MFFLAHNIHTILGTYLETTHIYIIICAPTSNQYRTAESLLKAEEDNYMYIIYILCCYIFFVQTKFKSTQNYATRLLKIMVQNAVVDILVEIL